MAASQNKVIRVAVGERNGRRSSTWRFWFGPNDIYAGFRVLSGFRKVSIHFPRGNQTNTLRYVGYTKTYAEKLSGGHTSLSQRSHAQWPGGEATNGCFVEFRFRVPASELRVLDDDNAGQTIWLEPPPADLALELTILSGPGALPITQLQRTDGISVHCIADRLLECGRRVWLVYHLIPAPTKQEFSDYKSLVRKSLVASGQSNFKPNPSTRINLTIEFSDGSAGELELAGDFLDREMDTQIKCPP